MPGIKKSVGSRGQNTVADVEIVQKLLNQWADQVPAKPLVVDGFCSERTIMGITLFQSRVMSFLEPDARVDPGGKTLKALNRGPLKLVQIPKTGPGHYSYAERKEQFGTKKTVASIQRAAKLMAAQGLEIGVGHISLKAGGKFPPHKSHQSGTDVDIRPLRSDGKHIPVTISNRAYSSANTAALVKILRADPNLKGILFNDSGITGVRKFRGHHNHLHVKFKE